jgi:hypothetical protein
MKGKNAGRKLNRRSKFGPGRLPTRKQNTSLQVSVQNRTGQHVGDRCRPAAQSTPGMAFDGFGNQLLSTLLPIEVSPHCRYIIKECRCSSYTPRPSAHA